MTKTDRLTKPLVPGKLPRLDPPRHRQVVTQLMHDVHDGSGCDILTIGQYLQPTRDHLPVTRWVEPGQFARYKRLGESIGFRHVESGPLVRSSYHAEDQVLSLDRSTISERLQSRSILMICSRGPLK